MKQRLAVTFEYTGYIEINIENGSIRLSTEDVDEMKNILQ